MDPNAALLAGLAAGLAIAMQVGAVSLLLVEAAVVGGPRVGVAAGMGVATADLGFAAIAAAAGGAAGAALSSHETEIRVIAAIVVAAIAVHGLIALARRRDGAGGVGSGRSGALVAVGASAARGTGSGRSGALVAGDAFAARGAGSARSGALATGGASATRDAAPRAPFARFLAITAANPLTIASFAAVAAALSLDGPAAAAAFAAGVGIASAAWHLLLTLAAGHAGRWMTPRVRTGFAVVGRLAVLGIAANLALG
jgi:threonine/homoserine/homoserine lactone efflux protein